MTFCLPKKEAKKLIKSLQDKKLDLRDVVDAKSSEDRVKMFKNIVGEDNAKPLNDLFEGKLAKDNTAQGMIDFIKTSTDLDPKQKEKMVKTISEMNNDKYVTKEKAEEIKKRFIDQSLGIDISEAEVEKIHEFSEAVKKAKKAFEENPTMENQINYGMSVLDRVDMIHGMTGQTETLMEQLASILNVPRTAMTTWDLSAPGVQGFGSIGTEAYWRSLKPMIKSFSNEKVATKYLAKIVGDPLYDLSQAGQSKLRISLMGKSLTSREDPFLSNLITQKIPGVKASERAYTIFLDNLRFERFKTLYKVAETYNNNLIKQADSLKAMGNTKGAEEVLSKLEDLSKNGKALEDIITTVNAFSGAGKIKALKGFSDHPVVIGGFFSPGNIQGTLQMLNPAKFLTLSRTARKAHIEQLLSMTAISTTVLGLGMALGAEVDWDPRSANFGKVIIGNTRIDVTGGKSGYVTFLARIMATMFGQEGFKSSTTGKMSRYNTDTYKGMNLEEDELYRFFRSKLAPVPGAFLDIWRGKNIVGEKVSFYDPKTLIKPTLKLFTPMTLGDIGGYLEYERGETKGENIPEYLSAMMTDTWDVIAENPILLIGLLAAGTFGININTYDYNVSGTDKKKSPEDLFKASTDTKKTSKTDKKKSPEDLFK